MLTTSKSLSWTGQITQKKDSVPCLHLIDLAACFLRGKAVSWMRLLPFSMQTFSARDTVRVSAHSSTVHGVAEPWVPLTQTLQRANTQSSARVKGEAVSPTLQSRIGLLGLELDAQACNQSSYTQPLPLHGRHDSGFQWRPIHQLQGLPRLLLH